MRFDFPFLTYPWLDHVKNASPLPFSSHPTYTLSHILKPLPISLASISCPSFLPNSYFSVFCCFCFLSIRNGKSRVIKNSWSRPIWKDNHTSKEKYPVEMWTFLSYHSLIQSLLYGYLPHSMYLINICWMNTWNVYFFFKWYH